MTEQYKHLFNDIEVYRSEAMRYVQATNQKDTMRAQSHKQQFKAMAAHETHADQCMLDKLLNDTFKANRRIG